MSRKGSYRPPEYSSAFRLDLAGIALSSAATYAERANSSLLFIGNVDLSREVRRVNSVVELRPLAPVPRAKTLSLFSLLHVLATNPLEAWTAAHFEASIVVDGPPIGKFAVSSDPTAIRRVLLENSRNHKKDWLQRRVLSAGLAS